MWHPANPLLYLSSAGKGQGSFYCGRTGLCMGSLPFHCGLEGATGHGGPMVAIGAGLPPSLLCVGGSIRWLAVLCSPWRLLYLNATGGGCLESSLGLISSAQYSAPQLWRKTRKNKAIDSVRGRPILHF